MSIPLDQLPATARDAWTRLRDELARILGDDLVAVWAYGGTTSAQGAERFGDLDTYVLVQRTPDARTAQAIQDLEADIARTLGVDWDAWYVLEADARGSEPPRHAFRSGRRDTSWAFSRAHWLAGRFAHLHGHLPEEVVPPPTWSELEVDLDREMEHLEAHVAEGDTDPYEATYAFLNGSRILRAVDTGDVVITKRAAGPWGVEHLPSRWHLALEAAGRAYDGNASAEDAELLAREVAPFVAMVRERLPGRRAGDAGPRWSGS